MGCASSKLDDLPAVMLCRERCAFLDEAIQKRYELAEAHIAYIHSLKGIGRSLNSFIGQDLGNSSGSPPSPKLNLPPQRKGDPVVSASIQAAKSPPHHHSHSNSGSHLHFHSDSDDDDDDSGGSLHHSDHSSPLHVPGGHIDYMDADQQGLGSFPGGFMHMNYMKNKATPSVVYEQRPVSLETVHRMDMGESSADQQGLGSFPGGFMHMNYMKNKATPSVVYEQRPVSPETVHRMDMGESSSSTSYYPNSAYPNSVNSNPYPYYGYLNYGSGTGGYYGGGSSPPPYGVMSGQQPPAAAASSSKPPPPPPSPPRASAWDFLNPFENYEKYFSQYTPSRDSKEVREEEGIPDLEDEDYQHEVVKEVHGDQKFAGDGGGKHSKAAVVDDEVGGTEASLYQTRPSVSMENEGGGVEYEVHVVDKKVVDDEERSDERPAYKARAGPRNAFEAAKEIEIEFQRASECGNEIAQMLEVGKLPYNRKHASYKMLHVVTPSLSVVSSQPSTSKHAESSSSADKAGPAQLDFDEDVALRSRNLSSTLHKLYLWEKKLYNEVKAEEKMRVIHDRKCRKLKRLDERGAEAHKVDSTRTLIRSLSTKIRIAIQVVDKISVTINKIRDEELWPQLNELIQGFTRMWKSMLECHRNQCLSIREARGLGPIGSGKKLGDAHLDATLQLERELISWTSRFTTWISVQKAYVKALNNWLLKCLLYEPEETPDGIVPFSPGRLGAPPVFVICNQWSQAMERISEREVVESMHKFTMSVLQIWEHDKHEMRQMMMANKDLERKVKNLDRDDQKIQKEIQALDKKVVLVSGDGNSLSVAGQIVYQSDTSNDGLQVSLQRIFEAMERFTANSMKAYEELLQRSEEEKHAKDHEGVS